MSVKNLDNILFTEKYRPNTLNGCILPERIKSMLEDGVKMNMLFYGSAGIGKTENIEFEEVDELSETVRGTGGFGSTGK